MGQIIFAANEYINENNLNGWANGGPIALGAAAFQQDILTRVYTTIQNTLKMHGQGVVIWDITGCGRTSPKYPSQQYLGDPRFLDPNGAGLTVQTSYNGPYVPPNSTLGQQGIEPAMNAIADQVFAAIRSAGLDPGICVKAEKVSVNAAGDLDGSVSTDGELIYDTTPNQLADLDAKITYAYNRWGCHIFYVDSNAAADDVLSTQQTVGNPTFAPAWVYTQLRLRHPDCLICPEEWYPGAFSFPSLGINDPAYQYDKVIARYSELRNPWMSPFLSTADLAANPTAFTLINVSDTDPSDLQSDQPYVVYALQHNQCVLMAQAWMPDSPDVAQVISYETAAGTHGF